MSARRGKKIQTNGKQRVKKRTKKEEQQQRRQDTTKHNETKEKERICMARCPKP